MVQERTMYSKDEEEARGKDSAMKPDPFNKGDWHFKPMVHAPSQAMDRRPEFKEEHWHQLHDKVHAVLNDRTKQVTDSKMPSKIKDGEVVFYSRKQKQGYIGNVNHANKELRIVTVLPKEHSKAVKPNDQRIVLDFVEEFLDIIYLD